MKCSVGFCARDAQKSFHGRHVPGRPPEGSSGVPYCAAHYEQLRRGEEPKAIRKRGPSPRVAAITDCVAIARHHGYNELADLLERLGK